MRVKYDHEADALYIELIEDAKVTRTVQLSQEIALDFGLGEKLIGIEILDAKTTVGNGNVPKVLLENLMSEQGQARRGNL
ncbi:MAG: DUF2283 domain-containing protein [Chloroherpetonaceae bacterium]